MLKILLCFLFFVISGLSKLEEAHANQDVNIDTISSILNILPKKFISVSKTPNKINSSNDTELTDLFNSEEFKTFQGKYPNNFSGFDPNNPATFSTCLEKNLTSLTPALLMENKALAEKVFTIFIKKNPNSQIFYSAMEFLKTKHIEHIRSVEYSYEYQNKYLVDYIGNGPIEKKFGFSFRILDFNFFLQKDSILLFIYDFIKNNNFENPDKSKILDIINKVKNYDVTLMANLNILTLKFEFKPKDNLSFGFATNLNTSTPYLLVNITNEQIFKGRIKPNGKLYLGLNSNNILYAKYAFSEKLKINSGFLYSKKMYSKKIYEKKITVKNESIGKAFDASNFSLFSKGIFDYDLDKINYLRWFLSKLTISDTIMFTRYSFYFETGQVPYLKNQTVKTSYNIVKNYFEILLSRDFNLGRFFAIKIPFGINFDSRLFGENGILADEYKNSVKVMYNKDIERNRFEAFIGLSVRFWKLNLSAKYSNLGWGGRLNFDFAF